MESRVEEIANEENFKDEDDTSIDDENEMNSNCFSPRSVNLPISQTELEFEELNTMYGSYLQKKKVLVT